jgi:hypothetical protein
LRCDKPFYGQPGAVGSPGTLPVDQEITIATVTIGVYHFVSGKRFSKFELLEAISGKFIAVLNDSTSRIHEEYNLGSRKKHMAIACGRILRM